MVAVSDGLNSGVHDHCAADDSATSHQATYTLANFSVYGSMGIGRKCWGGWQASALALTASLKDEEPGPPFVCITPLSHRGMPTVPYSLKGASCTQRKPRLMRRKSLRSTFRSRSVMDSFLIVPLSSSVL